MLIKTDRIFADHYQFYIYDSAYDHYSDDRLQWTDENRVEFGYLTTDKAIYVNTSAGLNDHRARVYIDEKPELDRYERVFSRDLAIPSGVLTISAPADSDEDKLNISIAPGNYSVKICSNSIGKDLFTFDDDGEEMEDEEYFKHDELSITTSTY